MVRTIPPERFGQLVVAATRVFLTHGYRLTQMADVASELGVAKGTLYGYVESKEALFDAAVRHADGHIAAPKASELPLRTPPPGQTIAYIRSRIAAEAQDMVLVSVIVGGRTIKDPAEELALVISDLYQRIARNRRALKLVDRCASDYPELAAVWFGEGRGAQLQLLVELIESRVERRRYRPVGNAEVVARTLLETLAFWALHRHFGPTPPAIDDELAKRTLIELFTRSLLERP